ncbi:MAG: thioredoxin [Bacteroidota bacterium]
MKGNFETIINDSRPVVVDFHALWCGPCKTQSPILKELAAELGDRVKVIKIDVDQNSNIASQYQIQSVPTLIVFKNGKPVWRHSGVVSKADLLKMMMQNI